MAKKLIKFIFFQDENNIERNRSNYESIWKPIKGKNEMEIVNIILYKIKRPCVEDLIIKWILTFVRKHREKAY